jgi:DNA repair exonuclease SbcCD ATPase subunit
MTTARRLSAAAWLACLLLPASAPLAQELRRPAPVAVQPAASTPAALLAEIQALGEELRRLREQLAQHAAARPVPPPPGASEAARDEYRRALALWEKQQQALREQFEVLSARADELQRELDRLEARAASPADLLEPRKTLDAIRKELAEESGASPPKASTRKGGAALVAPAAP